MTLYNPIPILQDSSHYGCSMNGWAIIHGPYHKFQLAFNTASHFCRLANLLNKNLYVQFLEERSEHKYMHCYQRKPKTFKISLHNETQIVFAFAFVVLGIYCLENLVSYNAEGTNTFSVKSHNLRIWLGDEALATISNKQANWLCILIQISTDKTLHRTQEMKVLR